MTTEERTIIRQAKLINELEEDLSTKVELLDNKRSMITALEREVRRLRDRMFAKGVEA